MFAFFLSLVSPLRFPAQLLLDAGDSISGGNNAARMDAIMELFRELSSLIGEEANSGPLLQELQSVIQMVAVEVLEIRGSRAMHPVANEP